MRVNSFKGKIAIENSDKILPTKNFSIVNIKNRDKFGRIDSIIVFIPPPRDNLNIVRNYTKRLHET